MPIYGSQSLLWMRHLLNKSDPKYPTVIELIQNNWNQIYKVVPVIGEVVLFNNPPHGNIALCVRGSSTDGSIILLYINKEGIPYTRIEENLRDNQYFAGSVYWDELK